MKTRPAKHPSGAPGSVRIIGGRWRATRLPVVDATGLRPTADRVRETVFNWLQPALPGARVLDLFAGSGAFGLEAVSRGAREAHLVERDPRACESLQSTVLRLGAGEVVHVHRADALEWLRVPVHGRFDIVFVDPPFAGGIPPPLFDLLSPWTATGGWLYLEAAAGAADPGPDGWALHREGRTREVRYALFRHREGASG